MVTDGALGFIYLFMLNFFIHESCVWYVYGWLKVFISKLIYILKNELLCSNLIITIMFMTRFFGRTVFAAVRAESSAAAVGSASASTSRTGRNPLEEFFEADRDPDEDKPVVYGMGFYIVAFCIH